MNKEISYSPITIKRINGEIKQFMKNQPDNIRIFPNPDNILEVYFRIKGHVDSPFKGGEYLCKLVHHPMYPLKAPDYYVMTPNGRFEIDRKICLTNSGYHQNEWAPAAWNLLTLLNGFQSIWHSNIKEDKMGISHIRDIADSKISELASQSIDFNNNNLSKFNKYFIDQNSI